MLQDEIEDFGVLSITRKPGQAIVLDGNIEVIIREVVGHQVRIVVHAPKRVTIRREEATPIRDLKHRRVPAR